MSRGDQLERQWKIIQALIASKRGKTAQELAEVLDCNLRSVYRDLAVLQTAGFPICNEKANAKKVWTVMETYKSSIPLPLDMTELMALYFSLDMLRAMHDTAFYDSLESLYEKIKTTLPPESTKFLQNFQKAITVDQKQYRQYGKLKTIITGINDAIMRRSSIDIIYFALKRKSRTKRMVDPYRIWFINGTFYLIGYCHLRQEVRTFALDRIRNIAITDSSFTIPEDFDFNDFMSGGFGAYSGIPEKVCVSFAPEIAGYIEEKIWHKSQHITRNKNGSILFEATVAVNEELENWLLSWGAKARVLEPVELKERMVSEAAKMASAYRIHD
ncbi:MAG: transcriptional regulator [Deltaproteobacteria bacterium]|nr:transcriptional regulator [Deltaproteobacteria bacterium]